MLFRSGGGVCVKAQSEVVECYPEEGGKKFYAYLRVGM